MTSIIDWRNRGIRKSRMNDITTGLDGLEISVLAKAVVIGKSVTEVTIGPNSKTASYVGNDNDTEAFSAPTGENTIESKNMIVSSDRTNYSLASNSRNDEYQVLDNSSRSILKLLDDMEQQRKLEVKERMNERVLRMEKNSRMSWLKLLSKHQNQQRENIAKLLKEEEMILRQQREEEILASQRQQQYAQEHRQHAQRINELNERIKEAEKRQKEEEEEERQRLIEKKSFIEKIHHYQLEYRNQYEQIVDLVRQCKDKQEFKAKAGNQTIKLKKFSESMELLIRQCKAGEVSSTDVEAAASIIQQTEEILQFIREVCDKIAENIANGEKQKEEENAKAAEELKAKSEQELAAKSSDFSEDLSDFVDKESYQKYLTLQQHLQAFENSYNNLMSDDRLKQFRFSCQKAVNIPVNAISPTSASHLQDKLSKLSRLISGQTVEVGNATITASSHPQGVAFCKNLLARKFVWQGELTVSSKPEAAFAIAAVMEALWADYPDFGELVLAHFHRECPYLIPMFMPQIEGQSNEDYYKSLGYRYNDSGEVEKQDKFLKRMSGIMRLYAAVLITRPCRYQQNKTNPHGLSHAWHWLACILNMDPRPDICATLIYDFLEVAGNSMYTYYGQQFQKLLHLICKEYFPKIEKVTPSMTGGPMIRLEAFLQKILKQGHIPPPVGVLPPNFW